MARKPTAPHADVSEGDFLPHLRKRLGGLRYLRLWRQLTGNLFACYGPGVYHPVDVGPPAGAADISGIVFGYGWRLEIEVKDADGVQSSEQIKFEANVREWGGVYLLLTHDPTLSMDANCDCAVKALEQALRARIARGPCVESVIFECFR